MTDESARRVLRVLFYAFAIFFLIMVASGCSPRLDPQRPRPGGLPVVTGGDSDLEREVAEGMK